MLVWFATSFSDRIQIDPCMVNLVLTDTSVFSDLRWFEILLYWYKLKQKEISWQFARVYGVVTICLCLTRRNDA